VQGYDGRRGKEEEVAIAEKSGGTSLGGRGFRRLRRERVEIVAERASLTKEKGGREATPVSMSEGPSIYFLGAGGGRRGEGP